MQVGELMNIFRGRSVAYNVFSRVFIDIPDAEADVFFLNTLPHMLKIADASDNEDLIKGAEMLREFFGPAEEIDRKLEDTRLERSKDYTKLFILGKVSIPIYESIYLSPTHLTKQEPWEKVKEFYTAHFFKRVAEDRTMEDHISMELQFIGLLSSKTAEYLEDSQFEKAETAVNDQYMFISEHLAKWAFLFCDKTASEAECLNTGFYPAYTRFMKGFLESDIDFLKELTEI